MAGWIVVVDDDLNNLKLAGHILSKNNYRVTAVKSGEALLTFVRKNRPDLILLDILMPGMDGFETLEKLRELEKEQGIPEIPVIFLTADEKSSSEDKGFEMGVSDYIRKPFIPEILLRRVQSILSIQQQIIHFQEEASTDKLTGFLNKGAMAEQVTLASQKKSGYLMMIDLDSFKLVNDLYGHEMGDEILRVFAKLIRENVAPGSLLGRIGGDEFQMFGMGMAKEKDLQKFSANLNAHLVEEAKRLMGEDMGIPLGASIGITYMEANSSDYHMSVKEADQALYQVKRNGKHGYSIYKPDMSGGEEGESQAINLKTLSILMQERNISDSALLLNQDAFIYVYRFVMRYIERYHRNACKLLLTLSPDGDMNDQEFAESCDRFGEHITVVLRKSDLVMRCRKNQFFVFFTDIREDAVEQVIGHVMRTWGESDQNLPVMTYETEFLGQDNLNRGDGEVLWVAVVDDDVANLKIAGHVLSKNNMRVTALRSGKALLDFVQTNRPDMILLDVKMPEMDGFETFRLLKMSESEIADIPVIFLTGNEDESAEAKALSLGAMDYIRKPFTPEALSLRIRQIVQLLRLQKNLGAEVDRKTRENEQLLIHVVQALADAIDAKDTYTNGHSGRVAEYSREIAKRFGYDTKEQSDIYIMGLLHDVGKIGVPDEVINKPGRLNDEEFEQIKKHPVVGARILKKITEMPNLAVGAHWHHERYGGGGYPDGLKGEEIPEEARIIAVADAYDAMTSYRSYRDVLSQEKVREELEKGKGTQFDPRFADIMLRIMDEDKEYDLREHDRRHRT